MVRLAGNAVRTLRMVATLVPEWVHDAGEWPSPRRTELVQALHNLVDSCEIAFRRLLGPVEPLPGDDEDDDGAAMR